jgi:hypothetical protein
VDGDQPLSMSSAHHAPSIIPPPDGLPTTVRDLSMDLLVAREIFAETHGKGSIPFETLVKALSEAGLANADDVSMALDVLFDQGIVRAEWTQTVDGKNVRGLAIAGEAKNYVQTLVDLVKA